MKPSVELLKKGREVLGNLDLIKYALVDDYTNPTACCAIGAIRIASDCLVVWDDPRGYTTAMGALNRAAKRRGFKRIADLNDAADTTKKDVLAAYDEAIALVAA